eukprot:scaffold323314_cov46-Prasinocladus_malaysianus.AAC.1
MMLLHGLAIRNCQTFPLANNFNIISLLLFGRRGNSGWLYFKVRSLKDLEFGTRDLCSPEVYRIVCFAMRVFLSQLPADGLGCDETINHDMNRHVTNRARVSRTGVVVDI